MMKNIIITRFYHNDKKTLGDLFLYEENRILLMLKTLELPWRENKSRISCIPDGFYQLKVHSSPKFGWCLWVQDVPGRSEILIHNGNYTRQILGCILPGIIHDDLDKDGIMDVKHSGIAMEALRHYIGSEKDLTLNIRYS